MKIRNFLTTLVLLTLAGAAYGQGGVGTILGTVTDDSGAVVAKAQVQVINISTNATQTVETSDAGTFSVPYLKPAVYQVSVQLAGFQRSVISDISLAVDQDYRVDVKLKTGAVNETVEV